MNGPGGGGIAGRGAYQPEGANRRYNPHSYGGGPRLEPNHGSRDLSQRASRSRSGVTGRLGLSDIAEEPPRRGQVKYAGGTASPVSCRKEIRGTALWSIPGPLALLMQSQPVTMNYAGIATYISGPNPQERAFMNRPWKNAFLTISFAALVLVPVPMRRTAGPSNSP